MKKLFLTLWCVALTLTVSANPIGREQARKQAAAFLQNKKGSHQLTDVTNHARLAPRKGGAAQGSTEQYFVFNRGKDEGFVIVGADDQASEVLGYCDKGSFDYATMPENMREWLDGYATEIAALQNGSARRAANVGTHPMVPQLITTTWSQGNPYNLTTPNNCVTGCVATAMAQLLYYNRDKSVTETQADIPGYVTRTEGRTVSGIAEGAPIDWANMKDKYSGSESNAQKQAVANLMLYCGVSVEMDYTSGSSGAYSYMVAEAMRKYFGYGSSVQYVLRSNYSNADWDDLVYNELANDRPIYLAGANSQGGHAFVCDGYDGEGLYHINWGWGGMSDGYYLMNKLTPGSQGTGGTTDGYNDGQEAIIGIVPEDFDNKPMTFTEAIVKTLCTRAFDANGDGILTYGEAAKVTELGDALQGARTMQTFNELKYFTALTEIPDNAFSGCSRLTTVRLPKNVQRIGDHAFSGCVKLRSIPLSKAITNIGSGAFENCTYLASIELPAGIQAVGDQTFKNCTALTTMTLPESVTSLGAEAFSGCTKLKTFVVRTSNPATIAMGSDVFGGIDLSSATLHIHQGGKALFATADQWSAFGQIYEVRTQPAEQFIPLTTDRMVYIKNVGTGMYLTKGEAWGTQGVVGREAMRYYIRHDNTLPEGNYHLYSPDTGNSRHLLFRTTTDSKVGQNVQATFVDGSTDNECRWTITPVEGKENTYLIQIPKGRPNYNASKYLGVQTNHKSNSYSPTYGAYSDIAYASYSENCQWQFVDYDATYGAYNAAMELQALLEKAYAKRVDVTREQAIFDDLSSTTEQLLSAQMSLRRKLNIIGFADPKVKEATVAKWDLDNDGEITYTEAAAIDDTGWAYYAIGMTTFDEFQYFTGMTALYGNAFQGNTDLVSIKLPETLTTMYYNIFYGCSSLPSIELPKGITQIGANSFQGCTSLRTVTLNTPNPASIALGDGIFQGVDLSKATLLVPQGSRELYAAAPVWKEFGTIRETRTSSRPRFSEASTEGTFYIYNLGAGAYINKGEAYGTQAVVALEGLKYQLKRTNSMPEDVYYLANGSNIIKRVSTDSKVGVGVKACFVDGSVSTNTYWKLTRVGENIYTLQVPENNSEYVEGEYLGTQTNHDSEVAVPTSGLYYDVVYDNNPERCQWAFVSMEDFEAAQALDANVAQLKHLLSLAAERGIDATAEQAVYDNFDATANDISSAIASLSAKLGIIAFADERAKKICINAFDLDNDGELSQEEAAAVNDIGGTFKGATTMRSLDELRYFTGITELPAGAFTNCVGLVSIYLPSNVRSISDKAFTSTGNLRYIAIPESASLVQAATASAINKNVTLFVPASQKSLYETDEFWGTLRIEELTGTPVITADDKSREYGKENPTFTFNVTGAPINGTPSFYTGTDAKSTAGEYDIVVEAGSVSNPGVVFNGAKLTIERAPLTITARSHTRNVGEPNPTFTVSYRSFRNNEKAATAFIVPPTIECEATEDSPAGDYEIKVYGAETPNYDITYVNGILTIIDPVGVRSVNETTKEQETYDLSGRRVNNNSTLQKGIYVVNGKKIIKR